MTASNNCGRRKPNGTTPSNNPKPRQIEISASKEKTMTPEQKLLNNVFSTIGWMPENLRPSQVPNMAGARCVANAPEDIKSILTVETEDDAETIFMDMVDGWFTDEYPCCEEDVELMADNLLMGRNITSMRCDVWTIQLDNPDAKWDWDRYFRWYQENKKKWVDNAFEMLRVQHKTIERQHCDTHRDPTEEEKEQDAKLLEEARKRIAQQYL